MLAHQNRKDRRAVKAIAKGKGIDPVTPRSIAETPSLLDDYLTAAELVEQIGVTLDTLKRWNRLAIGPPFTMVGRQRLYHRDSARAWLKSREQISSVAMPA
jgi:hypothetical protein